MVSIISSFLRRSILRSTDLISDSSLLLLQLCLSSQIKRPPMGIIKQSKGVSLKINFTKFPFVFFSFVFGNFSQNFKEDYKIFLSRCFLFCSKFSLLTSLGIFLCVLTRLEGCSTRIIFSNVFLMFSSC